VDLKLYKTLVTQRVRDKIKMFKVDKMLVMKSKKEIIKVKFKLLKIKA